MASESHSHGRNIININEKETKEDDAMQRERFSRLDAPDGRGQLALGRYVAEMIHFDSVLDF